MLIARQKFRSRTLGYYIRSCNIIMCNMRETWGLFYSRAMRTLAMSCHMLQHVHAGKPAALVIHGITGITYGCAIRASRTIFIKNNRLTF